jgi:hypothetical protein
MRTLVSLKFVAPAAAAALALLIAPMCWAQTATDLQAENQRLRNDLDQLKKDLKASQDRVKLLEQQIAAMQQNRSSSNPPPAPEPEKVTVDESVPLASPRAMFNHLTTSYEADMSSIEIGAAGDAKRRGYLRELQRWVAAANQRLRGPIKWHARLAEPWEVLSGRTISLVAVDPVTDVQLGNAFAISLSRSTADRLAKLQDRGELGVLVLRGVLVPEVRIAEGRQTRGPIDNPPFIGPFTEFLFRVEVKSILPVKEDANEQTDQPTENPKP